MKVPSLAPHVHEKPQMGFTLPAVMASLILSSLLMLPIAYSLYSDFFWYEIGDVICIGDTKTQYYCIPKDCGDIVAKTRLAAMCTQFIHIFKVKYILALLGAIGDEDSRNHITHYLDHEDGDIRLAACKAALTINTEYMKTSVRHQLAMEKDEAIKPQIQEAFNQARGTNV